ncbi:MAG: HesA/MoeB/ThiF family protein [Bacteroidales bacterium]
MDKIFSEIELRRYAKQIRSPLIGLQGQEKLKKSRVLVIGAGSMGTPVLQYLAAAGIGVVGICDFKTIQESDYPSQIMYGLDDLGKLKTIVAKEKIQLLNPFVILQIHNIQLREENVNIICEGYDLLMDCTNEANVLPFLLQKTNIPTLVGRIGVDKGEIAYFPSEPNRKLAAAIYLPTDETCLLGSLCGTLGCLLAYHAVQTILADFQVPASQIRIDVPLLYVK